MKRFFFQLFIMITLSLMISIITIGALWIYSSYKELPFQTFANYVFFSSFFYIVVGLYTLKDSSNINVYFGIGDTSGVGMIDDTGTDLMQAKSLYTKKDSKTVEEMNNASRFFTLSTMMLLVGSILIAFSYFASI